jgi:hypothetical protein
LGVPSSDTSQMTKKWSRALKTKGPVRMAWQFPSPTCVSLEPLRTQAKSHDHELVRAQKRVSKGRPNTPPHSCSVVTDPQVSLNLGLLSDPISNLFFLHHELFPKQLSQFGTPLYLQIVFSVTIAISWCTIIDKVKLNAQYDSKYFKNVNDDKMTILITEHLLQKKKRNLWTPPQLECTIYFGNDV